MSADFPQGLAGVIGQSRLKELLATKIDRAVTERRPLPHMLFNSPPATGKSTLARRIAEELRVDCRMASGAALVHPGDLVAPFTTFRHGDILLVKGIEAVSENALEVLLMAVEKCAIDIKLGEGSKSQVVTMPIEQFTLIGTTSRPARVNRRLLPWLAVHDFAAYSRDEITDIVRLNAAQRGLHLNSLSAQLVVDCANGSVEAAGIIVRRIVDYLGGSPQGEATSDTIGSILDWFGYEHNSSSSIGLADRLVAMSGREFEEFVANEFRRCGYRVEFTETTGDHGIDLILYKSGTKAVVQCKRWDAAVGEPVLRDFFGSMVSDGAAVGFVITASQFTAQARAFAANKPLRLIDLDHLLAIAQGTRAMPA